MLSNRHTLMALTWLTTAACASAPRPAVLVGVDQQLADESIVSAAATAAEGNLAEAKRYHGLAGAAYEDGDIEQSETYAEIAQTYLDAALEQIKTAEARERIAAAEQRQVEATKAQQDDEVLLAKLEKRIARMEKILELEKKLDSEKMASKRERKKLAKEIEAAKKEKEAQLEREKREAEVRAALTSVQAKVQTAEALDAGKFDAANLTAAKDNLMQAQRALADKDLDTALKVIATADSAATTAITTARAKYAEKSKELNLLEERKKLLEEAGALGASDAKQDERGVVLTLHEMFAPGHAEVKEEKQPLVESIGELARKYTDYPVLIEGYTDSSGSSTKNLALSTTRAQAVMDFLVQQEKLDPNRVKSAGYGEQRPIADNSSRDGRAKNRRIEVVFLFR